MIERKEIKNLFWLFVEKLGRLFLGFAVGAMIARDLGPSAYGVLALGLSLVAMMQSAISLGLDSVFVRELVSKENKTELLSGIIMGKYILTLILFAIAIFLNSSSEYALYLFLIYSSIILFPFDSVELIFVANSENGKSARIRLSLYLLSAIVKLITLVFTDGLLYLCIAYAMESVSLSLYYAIVHFKIISHGLIIYTSSGYREAMKIVAKSWPLIVSTISVTIYTRFDVILISHFLDSTDVGHYGAANAIIMGLSFVPTVMMNVLIARFAKLNFDVNELMMQKDLMSMFSVVGWLMSISVLLLSDQIVLLAFGDEYVDSIRVMNVISMNLLFMCVGVANSMVLIKNNILKYSMYKSISGAVMSIMFNLLFIQEYGIIGSAYASLLGQMTSTVLVNIIIDRNMFIEQMKTLVLPFYHRFLLN